MSAMQPEPQGTDGGIRLISTASDAATSLILASAIDWRHVGNLQLWSLRRHCMPRPRGDNAPSQPMRVAGVLYGVTVIFEDGTWLWTDITTDMGEAIHCIQRLSMQQDKPIRRIGDDGRLRGAGY